MKICPTCRRTYEDEGLNFCLEDGSVLTLVHSDAAPTVVMNHPRTTSPSPYPGVQTTGGGQDPAQYSIQPPKRSSKAWLWVLGIFAVLILLCGGGFAGFFFYVASITNSNTSVNSTKGSSNSTNSTRTNTFTTKSPSPSTEAPGSVETVDLSKQVIKSSVYGTTEFTNGELLLASKEKGYYYVLVTSDDYKTDRAVTRVTVRNTQLADSDLGYGLVIHSDTKPLEKDYAFLIDSKRKRFRVVRHEPQDEVTVTAWTASKLINEGSEENILEARDKGEKIELYINGQLATTINNKNGPSTGVPGLYAGDGAKIGFKKLEIVK